MRLKKHKLSMNGRKALEAQIFLIPFYLGLWFFFLIPLIQSIRMSFSDVSVYVGGYNFDFIGLKNYRTAFLSDADFTTNVVTSITALLWKVPTIIILSLLMAMIINQDFRGRIVVRAIFFLPVIFASGIVLSIIRGDSVASQAMSGSTISGSEVTSSDVLKNFLVEAGLNTKIVNIATSISSNMFSLVWSAGLQMIIFLAGLQSIPKALYEASSIEGASIWENFWKVTLPMLSPIIFLNVIYTIIDTFTDVSNSVMRQIISLSSQEISKLGLSSAFAWSYFLVIGAVLLMVLLVYNKISKNS